MAKVKVISIGGQAPKVTTTDKGRKIYSSKQTEVITGAKGDIKTISRTRKKTTDKGSGVFVQDAENKTSRQLTPFEAAATKATSGAQTTKEGSTTYTTITTQKVAPSVSKQIVESKTTVKKPISTYSPVPQAKTKVGQVYQEKVAPIVRESSQALKSGFFLKPDSERYRSSSKPSETIPYALGLVGSVASYGRYSSKVVKGVAKSQVVVDKAIQATKVGKAVTGTKVGKFAVTGTRAVIEGTAIGKTTKEATKLTAGKQARELAKTEEFKEASRVAMERRSEELGRLRNFADQTIIGLGGKTQKYGEYLQEELTKKGVSAQPSIVKEAARTEIKAIRAGEVSSGLYQSSLVEGYGRVGIGKALERTKITVTKEALPKVIKRSAAYTLTTGGFIEGSSQSVTSDILRDRQVNYGTAAVSGAFGGFSARTIGLPIIKQSIKPTAKGKLIAAASEVFDPLETPADILRDVGESSVKGFRSIEPTVVKTVTPSMTTYSFGSTTPKASIKTPSVSFEAAPSKQVVQEFTIAPSKTATKTTEPSQAVSLASRATVPTRTQITLPTITQTRTSVFTPSTVPTRTQTTTTVPTRTQLSTRTQTTTTVPTRTQVTTPSIVPRLTGGLPIPPIRGTGGGGYSSSPSAFKSKKEYTPSATALIKGITAKKAPSSKTGLNIRPIIEGSKRKSLFSKSGGY